MRFKHPPAQKIYITSPFGVRTHPVSGEEGSWHNGIDFRAVIGTPLFSPEPGVVAFAKTADDGPSGFYVGIDTENGLRVSFAHMSKVMVRKGDKVAAGELLGFSGATGSGTGPHVHFRVRVREGQNWADVDPEDFL